MPYAEYSARDSQPADTVQMGGRQRGLPRPEFCIPTSLALPCILLMSNFRALPGEAQRITETVVKNNYQHDERKTMGP